MFAIEVIYSMAGSYTSTVDSFLTRITDAMVVWIVDIDISSFHFESTGR